MKNLGYSYFFNMSVIPDFFLNSKWTFDKAENTEELLEAYGLFSLNNDRDFRGTLVDSQTDQRKDGERLFLPG